MTAMTFDLETLYFGFLTFTRTAGMFSLLPIFSGRLVPAIVRVALSAAVAYTLFHLVETAGTIPDNVWGIAWAILLEFMVGLLMGLAIRMIFFAIELAGETIATEMGLMMTRGIDPFSDSQSSVIGRILFYFGLLIFFITGLHYEVIENFALGFQVLPAGAGMPGEGAMLALIQDSSHLFVVGLKMAAPFIAVNFVTTMTFAVLGKAVPKMNVLMVSFAVRIWVGTIVLLLSIGLLTQYIVANGQRTPARMLDYAGF